MTLGVSDSRGGVATQTFSLGIVPQDVNQPPVITSMPPTAGTVSSPLGYFVTAFDPEGQDLTFALLDAPDGMIIDEESGLLTWIPGGRSTGSQCRHY